MEPEVLAPVILAVLGSGGLGAVLAFRKTSAEAGSVAAATLIGVIGELRQEIARKDQVISKLSERISVLEAYARAEGHPIPPPDFDD